MSAEMATADKACLSCHATIAEPEHASEFFWLKGICSKCFPRCKYCLDYLDPVDPPEYFLGVIRSHPAKCWHWRCVPPDDHPEDGSSNTPRSSTRGTRHPRANAQEAIRGLPSLAPLAISSRVGDRARSQPLPSLQRCRKAARTPPHVRACGR